MSTSDRTRDTPYGFEQLALFAGCTRRQLRRVNSLSTEITVQAGHVLIQQGRHARKLDIILDGNAVVTRNGTAMAMLGPGDVIGELALLGVVPGDEGYPADIRTVSRTHLAVFNQREFNTLLLDVPPIAKRIRELAAERLDALRKAKELASQPSPARRDRELSAAHPHH